MRELRLHVALGQKKYRSFFMELGILSFTINFAYRSHVSCLLLFCSLMHTLHQKQQLLILLLPHSFYFPSYITIGLDHKLILRINQCYMYIYISKENVSLYATNQKKRDKHCIRSFLSHKNRSISTPSSIKIKYARHHFRYYTSIGCETRLRYSNDPIYRKKEKW